MDMIELRLSQKRISVGKEIKIKIIYVMGAYIELDPNGS